MSIVEGPLRVFVSHTSELREFPPGMSYVDAVERAVSATGHVIVDMADFPAASQPAAQVCAERVRGCDVYLGVLGTRYGSPVRDRPGVSYTELEFGTAAEAGLERLVFLLDTGAADVGIPVGALIDIEFGARQEAFRRRVRDSGLVTGSFASPAGLGQLVERSLRGLAETRRAGGGRRPGQVAVRVAPRPVFLAGREALLAELDAGLAADRGAGPGVVALAGLGGAGKTSVAVEYAYRQLARCGVVWQLAAEESAALAAGFGELAARLGGWDGAGDPVAAVHAALARRADWLLVFDNVPGPAAVRGMVPPAGGGQVVITSQYGYWPGGQALEVPVLDWDVAAAFLMDRTRASDVEQEAARELAGELGGLPLALEQAGAYMQASGRGIGEYLALFRERRTELLGRGEPAGYDKRVTTTWALAFAELGQTGPAAGLLRLVACCAAEDIPLDLLLQPRPGLDAAGFGAAVAPLLMPLLADPLARDEAVEGLRRYSLISAPRDGMVSVHRLVQDITVAALPADLAADWRRAAASVIEAALPHDPEDPAAWPVFAALLPHTQAALEPTSDGMQKVASHLGFIGNYAAARASHQQILEAREAKLGAEHPRALAARAGLAHWTGQAGEAAAARDQYVALLPVFERVLGAEHPETLTIYDDLANWTGHAGDAAAARDQYPALLPVLERVLGAEHARTLTARGHFANWTGKAGDAVTARDQFAALVPVRERVSGAEHLRTLDACADLANWTGEGGDAAAARDQFAALVPVRERVFGAEHPRTLITRADLAYWTGEAGDPVAARDQYAALRPVFERVLGAEHPRTLDVRGHLANWTGKAGDAAAARDQFAVLVPVRERVSSAEHLRTLDASASLAYWADLAEKSR